MILTNHRVIITNRYENTLTVPVVYVKDLGDGRAEVHVESNFHIETGYDNTAIYTTPGHEAKGKYTVSGKEFTERMTYIYKGVFERAR